MRRAKEQKGITLIALIITIIVLLILAVVAIGAVQNDGIINHAKNARDEYGKAQVNENTTLDEYLNTIEENLPDNAGNGESGNSGENDGGGSNNGEAGTITFTIDSTTYTATAGMTWEEWVKSDYNNTPFSWQLKCGSHPDGRKVVTGRRDAFTDFFIGRDSDNSLVSPSDYIISGEEYSRWGL